MTLYVSVAKALKLLWYTAVELSLLSISLNDDDLSLNVVLQAFSSIRFFIVQSAPTMEHPVWSSNQIETQ